MTVQTSSAIFFALTPDESLYTWIDNTKRITRDLIGEQMYLSDPPHMTLYLAQFPTSRPVSVTSGQSPHVATLRLLSLEKLPKPRIRLKGWHAFLDDPLTRLNTLFCEIAPESIPGLQALQMSLVEQVSPLRDPISTEDRFRPRWDRITSAQQKNVQEFGFPYLGTGWIPHFTIASVEPAKWDRLMDALRDHPPSGEHECSRITVYELIDGHPHRLEEIELTPPVAS